MADYIIHICCGGFQQLLHDALSQEMQEEQNTHL